MGMICSVAHGENTHKHAATSARPSTRNGLNGNRCKQIEHKQKHTRCTAHGTAMLNKGGRRKMTPPNRLRDDKRGEGGGEQGSAHAENVRRNEYNKWQ